MQAPATTQALPTNLQLLKYATQLAVLGLGIESVHSLGLHVSPPVTHPQAFPDPSDVALHAANDVKLKEVQAAAATQVVPLNAHVEM